MKNAMGHIKLAKRENNPKRAFLYVNEKQAKHVPVSPKIALTYFRSLGAKVLSAIGDAPVLVIGFAETATAIGAVIAEQIGEQAYYLHTTREPISDGLKIADFLEEHSHAAAQSIFSTMSVETLSGYGTIVFAEDEVSTGNTILNAIAALRRKGIANPSTRILVASLLNGIKDRKPFEDLNTSFLYLQDVRDFIVPPGNAKAVTNGQNIPFLNVAIQSEYACYRGSLSPRTGVNGQSYAKACRRLASSVFDDFAGICSGKEILILGTEECMYPAIVTGLALEETAASVNVHATTRSPIVPSGDPAYPLHSRIETPSFYDAKRKTYLYNLAPYDRVLVVTDAKDCQEAYTKLAGYLAGAGNKRAALIQWVP